MKFAHSFRAITAAATLAAFLSACGNKSENQSAPAPAADAARDHCPPRP